MNFKAKIISPLEKVFYDQNICDLAEYDASSALTGEKHSFCVAYTDEDYATIHYSINSCRFKVKSKIKKHIKVYSIEHVPAVYAAPIYEEKDGFLREYPGLFPDVLMPVNEKEELHTVEKLLHTLWVEIDTADIPAGEYAVDIEFYSTDDQLLARCTHTLCVIGAKLPEDNTVITHWFHTDCIADAYHTKVFSEKHWKAIEKFIKMYVEGGNTMLYTPLFTPPLDTKVGGERTTTQLVDVTVKNGEYTFGFEKLRRWITLAKKCGIKYFEMSHLFTQWGALHAPKIVANVDGKVKKIFGWETDSHGAEYEKFLSSFLKELCKELEALGLSDCTYFHISDEPELKFLESYEACSNIIRKYLKGYKIMDAMFNREFYDKGLLDVAIPGIQHSEAFIEKNVQPRFVYYCGVPRNVTGRGIAMPSYRNRICGSLLYAYEIEGFLHWGFNFYNSAKSIKKIDPYFVTDADKRFCAGDSFLVYPGDNLSPVPSVRFFVFRDGLQDMRALKLCEDIYGKEAVHEVLKGLNGGEELDLLKVPADENFTLKMREIINGMIAKAVKQEI